MSLTELQAKIGEVSIALIRGEEILITRNGKNLGWLIPFDAKYPKKPTIYNSTPKIQGLKPSVIIEDEFEPKHKINPLTGRPLSGVKKNCPICNESSPIELATKHYMEKHGDI